MPTYTYIFADSVYETLHQFVGAHKIHPILVNFTAALIPVSVGSDIVARVFDKQTLRVPAGGRCVSPRLSRRSPQLPAGCSGPQRTTVLPA